MPSEGALDLYWDRSPEEASDETSPAPGGKDFEGYRVYLGDDRGRLAQVVQFDLQDTTGFNTGLEAVALPDSVQIDGEYYWGREHLPRIGWILGGRRGPSPDVAYSCERGVDA